MSNWQPIETAPHDTELLLGWRDTFGGVQWRCVVDLARSTKGGWWHGQATHWQFLPQPPEDAR